MLLELKPALKLTYKLRLTPQMRLSLNLLQLPLTKLKEYIKQEIEKNPLLELADSQPVPSKEKSDDSAAGLEGRQLGDEKPWSEEDEEKKRYKESLVTKLPTLQEHLLGQLRLLTNTDKELVIGELIIGNTNHDGYLMISIEDIAKSAKATLSKTKEVLSLIQTFDPLGVAARNLRECLLLQLKAKGKESSLEGKIVDKYLPFLEKKRLNYIAKKLFTKDQKVSVAKIRQAIKEIAKLEPKPGRSFDTEKAIKLIPDAMLRKNKGKYEIILNTSQLPRITLNDKYKKMIKQKNTPRDAKEYLRERLRAARSLINAVDKRKETLQKVIKEIFYIQKDFLDNGAAHLKPMSLIGIANKIGKNKSTVSRAITNKYIATPQGIFELRYFLNSGIKQKNGEFLSSKSVKSKIKDLIKNESKKKPLTDQQIIERLKHKGVSISRRTITKYRNQLKILSSKSRRE